MNENKDSCLENKIYYHDTDAGAVVYYARYLEHLEEGRSEYCRARGIDLFEWSQKGVNFAVVHTEISYKSPARYGDIIKIYSRVEKIGASSLYFVQEIKRQQSLLVSAKTVLACVGNDFKPKPIPEEIKKKLI